MAEMIEKGFRAADISAAGIVRLDETLRWQPVPGKIINAVRHLQQSGRANSPAPRIFPHGKLVLDGDQQRIPVMPHPVSDLAGKIPGEQGNGFTYDFFYYLINSLFPHPCDLLPFPDVRAF